MKQGNGHKLAAAGTATLIMEPVMAAAHQGAVGVIVGVLAGAVAYGIIDDVEMHRGRPLFALPEPQRRDKAQATSGKKSLAYRLLVGKSVRDEEVDTPADLEEEEVEEDDAYVPEDILELGDLRPHVDAVFSNRLAILGMSGAGKSNLLAVTVEELGHYDAPLIVFDLKGEYTPLCAPAYLTNPWCANAQNVTRENARMVGQQIMRDRLHVVVDLSSYRSDADAALVMIGLIEGVAHYQKSRPNAERIPCTLVLEEAHYWLPENESQSTIKSVKNSTDGQSLLSYLQQVWFNVAKVGRSFGMGLIVATQRPADVDKRIISQAEWRFLLKALEPADLKVYRSYGLTDDIAQSLRPKQGEAYVIGPDGSRGVYHIRLRYSPDEAKSPGLANIRNVPRNDDRNSRNTGNDRSTSRNGQEWLAEPVYAVVPAVLSVPGNVPTGTSHARRPITGEERERIIHLAKTGTPRRFICSKLGKGNGYYDVVRQVLDEEGL